MAKIPYFYPDFNEDSDEGSQHDTSLPPLQRFYVCAQSGNVADRKAVVRIIQEIIQTLPADTLIKELPNVMETLSNIASESMLIAHVLEHVPQIAEKLVTYAPNTMTNWDLVKCSDLNNIISDYLIPLVVRNLGTSDTTIDKAAQSALIQLIKQGHINKAQVEIKVCPSILALSNSNILDVMMGSVTLMSRLAPLLGRDVTERVFLKRYSELCSDELFLVRKVCTSHFGDFCAVVGRDTFEKVLLPCYLNLCSDQVWGVRKASAAVIMFISCACSPAIRKSVLAPVFIQLLQDECKWVKLTAFYSLGPFISTFANPMVTSIAYNSLGELVLVNSNGSEFLMDSLPDKPSLMEQFFPLKDYKELNFNTCDEEPPNVDIKQSEPMEKNVYVCLDNLLQPQENGKQEEEIPVKEEVPLNEEVEAPVKSDGIKEMVETIKNVVLSYRIDNPNLSNGNVIQNDIINQCDNLDKALGEMKISDEENATDENRNVEKPIKNGNYTIPEIKTEMVNNEEATKQVNTSETEVEDDLHLFNSYNYWYIQPELPLDPDIIRGLPRHETGEGDVSLGFEDGIAPFFLEDSLENSLEKATFVNNTHGVVEEPPVEKKPTQDIVPQPLIDHYVYMANPNLVLELDCEMTYRCAFSLPAVALTLGSKNWALLKQTVDMLATDMQYKVRRTVASSLHELALILGPDDATENLTPLFDGFLKDLDEVRIGVLKHLAHFLKLISISKRNGYLPRLEEFLKTDNESYWRFREELGNQLLLAVPLFKPSDTAKYIGKIAQELLCDKVYAVREVAILLIIEIIRHISTEPGLMPHLLIKLAEKLAHSKVWKRRQTYALLCSQLSSKNIVPAEQFASEVLPHLLDLSWDPVANVRLVVGRILSQYVVNNEYFSNAKSEHSEGIQIVLKRLRADKDKDVREAAGEVSTSTKEVPEDLFFPKF